VSKPSEAIEDYAKAIYALSEQRQGPVLNGEVAERLGVSPPTATSMLKKLGELGLVEYLPYKGVTLTPAGEKVALEVIRHHRLLELYLAETLGVDVNEVHDEAERLEHVLSDELEERIDKALGFPTHDPHGDPIPDANLEWPNGDRKTSVPKASAARRG
jgi:DtxR family transcriptional regulator, Mn-dependent transcriptional regulator